MRALLIALALLSLGQTRTEIHSYRGARTRMAATIHTWTNGIGDGDWNNVGNWSTGALPGSGGAGLDTAIFDGTVTNTGPSVNMDRTGDASLYRIIIRPNFTGDIGGSGNYLIHETWFGNDESRLIHRGPGDVYFRVKGNTDADVVMDGPGHLYLDSAFDVAWGVLRSLAVKSGTVNVASTCSFSDYVVVDGPAATLTIQAIDTTQVDPDWILITAGLVTNHRTMAAANGVVVFGGKLDQRGMLADLALVFVGPQGRMEYTPNDTLGLTENPDVIVAGLLDGGGSNQDIVPARLIITQLGSVLGSAVQVGEGTYVDLDLREEYP